MTKRSPFRYFKTSPEIIRLAVMMYIRLPLSLRNVEDLLNEEAFDSLDDARRKLAIWRYDYNNVRPHSSLGNQNPAEARRALEISEVSAPGALANHDDDEYSNPVCRLSS